MLAGGGIKGGQVIGKTDAEGATVVERPVSDRRLHGHRLPSVLGIDHDKQNMSRVGRPIRIVDKGATPIHELF